MSEACRFEPQVIRATSDDRWTDALRMHVADCVDCAAAASITPWMGDFARISDREHILPDPAVLWLKAQLLRGSSEAARAALPLTIAQLISYGVIAAGWAALLMWKWDVIQLWLRRLTPTGIVEAGVNTSMSHSLSFFALVLLLGSATVMLGLHTILADE
ncbi:MAG: hypothetical protein QOH21_3532 [Acidobacteriota bacterium]|nr:hypothetical protein [Acidobacteriota bacterium]